MEGKKEEMKESIHTQKNNEKQQEDPKTGRKERKNEEHKTQME